MMVHFSGMRQLAVAILSLSSLAVASPYNVTAKTLPSSFSPPQVFENSNLVRNINLERSYPRETTNIVVQNVDKAPQSEYYFAFPRDDIAKVGGMEVKDKKGSDDALFKVELVKTDASLPDFYYLVHFPKPLAPSDSITLSFSYALLSSVHPLPAVIDQTSGQTIKYSFSAHLPSAYTSKKQKTKLKFPAPPIEFTKLEEKNADKQDDPALQGASLSYGPYDNIKPGSELPVSVRYEFTKPLLHASLLERDIEVSHFGGNLATEERYWLTNRAAKLKNQFSRVQWQMTQYSNPPTTAARELKLPLLGGASDPYYIDDIGNVSTSRFRPSGRRAKEALLEIKPRYPIFGGWNYSFKVGWNADLSSYLRKVEGEKFVLKVPFLEGPRSSEGIEYSKVVLRVILPEGAKNIEFSTSIPYDSSSIEVHKTFMDTLGRPAILLTAHNVVEDWREKGDLVVTYEYPWLAGFRKPITIATAIFGVFVTTWVVGKIDVRIGKK